ncbi:MAG: N-formylglutamate amidohydrolase [Deltaproteobacteria bacterium]|nr:N-formylglutamate amidohydrolase [Deltaproteobacteria bacterium]
MSFVPVTVAGPARDARLVITCEHASPDVPAEYANLGLAAEQVRDHIGWDIGAAAVSDELARQLNAPAVLSGASRLLVDCNRGLTDHDLMPHQSCGVAIPGNTRIDASERRARLQRFYEPFHAAIDATLASHPDALLLSIHSFTPALHGRQRPFDVGVLFDAFDDVAERLAAATSAAGFAVRMNEPYSGLDGLIFSARLHGRRHGLRYVELEINNRLLRSDGDARAVARRLVDAVGALLDPTDCA